MRLVSAAAVVCAITLPQATAVAAAIATTTFGCKTPADATKLARFRAKKDAVGLKNASSPLVATRACIAFAKGITVGIDEAKPPLSCVRLTGDLACYWVADVFIDLYPGEKGDAGGKKSGGHRH